MSAEVIARIAQLNEEIKLAREAYYQKATPTISDAAFDRRERELKELVAKHPEFAKYAPELSKVGSDLSGNGRVRHVRPMKSIENKYTKEEIVDFYRNVGVACAIEPKRDGVSCELRYQDGKFVQALTRGDGESGEDITAAVNQIKSIPKNILLFGKTYSTYIRGELVMRNSELERINKELTAAGQKVYASTRNLTAGTVKLKDVSQIAKREILFVPWDLDATLPDTPQADSHRWKMELLHSFGFPRWEGKSVAMESSVTTALDEILAQNKISDINADGVVIKVDSAAKQRELGYSSNYTNFQVCFKPQSASGTTYLRRVVWQVGRQGKLTPVAECDPVVLAGAVIVRANLNNLTWIEKMGLKVGAKVEMLRSGDVIPQITKVLDETGDAIVAPEKCECGTVLEVLDEGKSGIITHWCTNPACPGRVSDLFAFIGSRDILEIDGLGPEMSAKLVGEGYARNVGELFTFQTECLAAIKQMGEGAFAARMARKGFSVTIVRMIKSMEKAKSADWDRWIAALGIPMISTSLGRVISQSLRLDDQAMAALPNTLRLIGRNPATTIEGIGDRKTQMITEWANNPVSFGICKALFDAGVRPKSMVVEVASGPQPLAGTAFCITGEFPEFGSRDSISVKLVGLGAVAKSGVSSKTNLLLVGDAPGKTKLEAAKKLNIKMVQRDWLKEVFAVNGITLTGEPKFSVQDV